MSASEPREELPVPLGLPAVAEEISRTVAAPAADQVDRDGVFPRAAFAAIRQSGLLGALVPSELGGAGASIGEVAQAVSALAQGCASTGLILAMHSIQVAIIVRHGGDAMLELLAPGLDSGELLLANANSEIGLGGDRRVSICALEPIGGGFRIEKRASVVSYGADADGVLATARRTQDSPAHEQVMVVCLPPSLRLEPLGEWDTLGLRGTSSRAFLLTGEITPELIIDDYGAAFRRTSLAVSAVMLSSVWLGLAEAAASRAHAVVRQHGRNRGAAPAGSPPPPGSLRLAELSVVLHQLRAVVADAIRRYEEVKDGDAVESFAFATAMDCVKVASSTLAADTVERAMRICGLAGYNNRSTSTVARLLRDVTAAPLMINNDRTLAGMAQLFRVRKSL